ncbi:MULTISPECIES: dTDP-glucose pyrophosphorylase [Leuconostoc]|nr:dTDP-glucose pyrophosphorylase [Leuconostoc carnosum]SPJ44072.1 Prophage Lp2 protein 24 [Leuconostoc carnosum]
MRALKKIVLDLNYMRQFTQNKYIEAERKNRYIGAKMKKEATNYSRAVVAQAMQNGIQFNWPVKLVFVWYLPDKKIDPDNWSFLKKFIFDGMQRAIINRKPFLDNDNFTNVHKGYNESFEIDKRHPRLEIYEVEI